MIMIRLQLIMQNDVITITRLMVTLLTYCHVVNLRTCLIPASAKTVVFDKTWTLLQLVKKFGSTKHVMETKDFGLHRAHRR